MRRTWRLAAGTSFVTVAAIVVALAGGTGTDATAPSAAPDAPSGLAASTVPKAVHRTTARPVVRVVPGHLTRPARELPRFVPGTRARLVEDYSEDAEPSAGGGRDAAVQATAAAGPDMPAPLANFQGLTNDDNFAVTGGRYRPPDSEGDVGPSHYVQWINLVWGVFSKTGTRLLGPLAGNSLFTSLPGADDVCEATNQGDPLVHYDQLADRWVLSQFAFNVDSFTGSLLPPFKQCVAVSTTPDPTGSYCAYAFTVSESNFNDYGKMGIWPDPANNAYFFSFANFAGGTSYTGPSVLAVERAKMLTPGCPAAQQIYYESSNNPSISANETRMLPADVDGRTLPPANQPGFFINHVDSATAGADKLQLWEFDVDWTAPLLSSFAKVADLPVADFDTTFQCDASSTRQCVPQLGTTNKLDPLSTRLMYELNYRNFGTHESLVVDQTVDAEPTEPASRAGVRWYEIRNPSTAPTVHQQSTYAPADGRFRWMGSVAQDRLGNLAVGYSVSSTGMKPAVWYAGRLASDPLHQLTQGEASLIDGTGAQTPLGTASASGRWGDYTRLSVDPVDDCTFWYTNEYYALDAGAAWNMRIGSFAFPGCTVPTAARVTAFAARWSARGVRVTWRTANESGTLGYNVYRSAGAGPFRKLNGLLVGAKRAGSARAASYSFVDRVVKHGKAYTYRLQLVGTDGKRSWYGVGSAAS
jgi:hypothetical protein